MDFDGEPVTKAHMQMLWIACQGPLGVLGTLTLKSCPDTLIGVTNATNFDLPVSDHDRQPTVPSATLCRRRGTPHLLQAKCLMFGARNRG